jgi:ElaB/YqjD/DUF883 family membrane-anchored ribosome-binding protein
MARDRDADDLATLLDELRTTLDDLDRTLERRSDGDRSSRPSARPRGSDVVRFTEEYTIPTVISVLETTISSLELLQGVLRLANPDRQFSQGDASSRVDRRVREGTERALDDLRQVLTGTEPPTDPVARDVFEEARALTAEIESILDESRGRSADGRRRREHDGSGQSVVIPVDDERTDGEVADDGGSASGREAATDDEDKDKDDAGATVDVDAELESIRDEVASESATTDGTDEPSRGDEGGTGES